jgi:O-acetylhomoserine (thiol)-lyase
MERHCSNALAVARFLERHPAVAWVNYPGLSSHPDASLAEKYLPKGAGSIFTFGVKGGLEAGRRFIDTVRLFSLVANVGDARSLVIHPASTTHSQLDSTQLAAAGVREDTIRLSIGLEDPRDLLEDLDQALRKATDPGVLS